MFIFSVGVVQAAQNKLRYLGLIPGVGILCETSCMVCFILKMHCISTLGY